jgi:hypothetical protein
MKRGCLATIITVLLGTALSGHAESETREAEQTAASKQSWTIKRVGGDLDAKAEWDERRQLWRAGSSTIDTPLPEGYPAPTPPGAIELKIYPSVRRVEVSGAGRDNNGGFWPLFRHIQRENIAMTSPVEMDYPESTTAPVDASPWVMSFLYRTPELRAATPDPNDPRLTVRDTEPITVISLGGRGDYSSRRIARDAETLRQWLADQEEWQEAGPVRALLYNGPSIFPSRKWLEVQLPVKPKASPQSSD